MATTNTLAIPAEVWTSDWQIVGQGLILVWTTIQK